MKYQFSFYKQSDFEELEELALLSYQWEYPYVGLSRLEFCKGLHPAFKGFYKAWEHTVGMYRLDGKLVACIWNEGIYDGELFFLFDSKERAQDRELLIDMLNYCKMYAVEITDRLVRSFKLNVPEWNHTLMDMVLKLGYQKADWGDHCLIQAFNGKKFEVKLPEGYTIADGNTTPAFYLSNVHRMAFAYGADNYACEHGAEAFENLRKEKHYDKDLDLCILDPCGRPVAIAMIWYDERMPYCELEPLAVAWWERRKGLATAILHEGMNRAMSKYPKCQGMRGGDQPFYHSIGFEQKSEIYPYCWKKEVYISWDERSVNQDYSKEMLKEEK